MGKRYRIKIATAVAMNKRYSEGYSAEIERSRLRLIQLVLHDPGPAYMPENLRRGILLPNIADQHLSNNFYLTQQIEAYIPEIAISSFLSVSE